MATQDTETNDEISRNMANFMKKGRFLLANLYLVNDNLKTQKPIVITNPNLSKLCKLLMKDAPELPENLEKSPGFDVFELNKSQIFSQLSPFFNVCCQILEWYESSTKFIRQLCLLPARIEFQSLLSDLFFQDFLQLLACLLKVVLFSNRIEDKKLFIIYYHLANIRINGTSAPETNIDSKLKVKSIFSLFQDFSQFSLTFPELCFEFKDHLNNFLASLWPKYFRASRLEYSITKTRELELLNSPDKVLLPNVHENLFDYMEKTQISELLYYGYISSPSGLENFLDLNEPTLRQVSCDPIMLQIMGVTPQTSKNDKGGIKIMTVDCLKVLLQDNIFMTLFGNEIIKSTDPIDEIAQEKVSAGGFKFSSVLKTKFKKISSSSDSMYKLATENNEKFMDYCIGQFRILQKLILDRPEILAPKFCMILSLLSLATREMNWFITSLSQGVRKLPSFNDKKAANVKSDRKMLKKFAELLFLVESVCEEIKRCNSFIKDYLLELLSKLLWKKIKFTYASAELKFSGQTEEQFLGLESFISQNQNVSGSQQELISADLSENLESFVFGWKRLSMLLSSIDFQKVTQQPTMKQLFNEMNMVCKFTSLLNLVSDANSESSSSICSYSCSSSDNLNNYLSLNAMYFQRDVLISILKSLLDLSRSSSVAEFKSMDYLLFCASFAKIVESFAPTIENNTKSSQSAEQTENFIEKTNRSDSVNRLLLEFGVGTSSVSCCEDIFNILYSEIENSLEKIRSNEGFLYLLKQYDGKKTVMRHKSSLLSLMLENSETKNLQNPKGKKDKIPQNAANNSEAFELAGAESSFKNHANFPNVTTLINEEKKVLAIIQSLIRHENITIFNTIFHPTEFIRDKLENFVETSVVKILSTKPIANLSEKTPSDKVYQASFLSPSQMVKSIHSLILCCKILEHHVNINVEEILIGALLSELNHLDELDNSKFVEKPNSVVDFANWYTNLVSQSFKFKLCFDPMKKAFFSKNSFNPDTTSSPPSEDPNSGALAFKPEEYFSMDELKHLLQLIGPVGIKTFDLCLNKKIVEMIDNVGTVLETFAPALKELNEKILFYPSAADLAEKPEKDQKKASSSAKDEKEGLDFVVLPFQKKLKGLEKLLFLCIDLGSLFQFKNMLKEALESVSKSKIPLIFNVFNSIQKFYPKNLAGIEVFAGIDNMSYFCGGRKGIDHDFLKILKPVVEKRQELVILGMGFASLTILPNIWALNEFNQFGSLNNPNSVNNQENLAHLSIVAFLEVLELVLGLKSGNNFSSSKSSISSPIEEAFDNFSKFAAQLNLEMMKFYSKGSGNQTFNFSLNANSFMAPLFFDKVIKKAAAIEERPFGQNCIVNWTKYFPNFLTKLQTVVE